MNENGRANRVFLIGGSSGAIEATRSLLGKLPRDFPCPILVVIHTGPESPGLLPKVLQRCTSLIVQTAENQAKPLPGHVYVAPPDLHLTVQNRAMLLMPGPVENRHRPAIDPLFRSAARYYGPRAVGIILSGYLDDGCAGLYRVKQSGGVTIVQDPEEAIAPDMPRNAIERVVPDYTVGLSQMAELLQKLASEPVTTQNEVLAMDPNPENFPGKLAAFTCPECHGNLWEVEEGPNLKFRCRVGHAFTADVMLADQGLDVERALWAALRVLEEHGELSTRLATRAHQSGHQYAEKRYSERAAEATQNAAILRELLVHGRQEPRPARPLDQAEREAAEGRESA